jgi:two-component system, cell cycle sensor histidine kinase and response regulator CckA
VSAAAPPLNAPRILVVDDELGPRESLRMLLKPSYQIQTADGGRAALEQIPAYRPDMVILDIKMPEMDGLEVLRRIKRIDPAIEVVMITAYASLETVKMALTHGAFEYLIKPFSRQDLEDVVRRALGRRHAELGARGQVARLVEEMRRLAAKTRQLEEAARREAVEQSLRVTQLSILREIARTFVSQLEHQAITAAVTGQLQSALGYDVVAIAPTDPSTGPDDPRVVACAIRDAEGPLGWLVVDNRQSGRPVDPRERELLEMLSEYVAIALRNARLYGQIDDTKRSLEHLIASAGDAIITLTADDCIGGWNPAAERTFGVPAEQALGRPIVDLLPEPEYRAARGRLVEGGERETFEVVRAFDGSRVLTLAVTLSALRDRKGGLDGLIAIVRDITTDREIETQLHQSEKLTALGQLAGGIAHDFNNLLQAILGYAQLMKQNPANAELIERSLTVVESAAMDGSETVRRIQQFARLRPDEQFVGVDINQIVQDAVAITRPRWQENLARDRRALELKLELQAGALIQGRPAALSEVLTNLILNAMDAMPQGGRLTIATRHTPGREVRVTVSDTGVGMPETVRQRIFEPFYSTKGEAGSGLGLSMAYSIVRRHSGEIHVDSEPGAGTTFTLAFPIAHESAAPETPPPSPETERRFHVLVVDDNPQVLATLAEMMRRVGHTVSPAITACGALEEYASGRFDVVITNIGMAEMNGWEFAERLRALDPRVPLLFITGWGLREEDRARLTGLGVHRCLFKPVRPEDLDAALQDAAARR